MVKSHSLPSFSHSTYGQTETEKLWIINPHGNYLVVSAKEKFDIMPLGPSRFAEVHGNRFGWSTPGMVYFGTEGDGASVYLTASESLLVKIKNGFWAVVDCSKPPTIDDWYEICDPYDQELAPKPYAYPDLYPTRTIVWKFQ